MADTIPELNPTSPLDPDDVPPRWEYEGLTWAQHSERVRGQGLEEGLVLARREALLALLEIRHFEASARQRQRIDDCKDADLLSTWFERAKTAPAVGEIFRDPGH
ncbi:hypothetical protein G6O69_21500 [Pseudenhygromyxa sp. WMMC2535]|uniref:hypothetical protein n=1 Tax=Pseudenhygromyxa sp. WMMC2535 TaxID=2712867 RepID=UPI001552B313|nr:hypothetical protein [Pseudenhygromyxa sp. WMMC2535]NVB40430.1 hypothetical protein [Pseudenhygromyxa sp. WMMC2535]